MRKCKEKVNTNAAAEITDYIQTREKISIKKIVINNYFHFCYLTVSFLEGKADKNLQVQVLKCLELIKVLQKIKL